MLPSLKALNLFQLDLTVPPSVGLYASPFVIDCSTSITMKKKTYYTFALKDTNKVQSMHNDIWNCTVARNESTCKCAQLANKHAMPVLYFYMDKLTIWRVLIYRLSNDWTNRITDVARHAFM
eukprot:1105237_1